MQKTVLVIVTAPAAILAPLSADAPAGGGLVGASLDLRLCDRARPHAGAGGARASERSHIGPGRAAARWYESVRKNTGLLNHLLDRHSDGVAGIADPLAVLWECRR